MNCNDEIVSIIMSAEDVMKLTKSERVELQRLASALKPTGFDGLFARGY